ASWDQQLKTFSKFSRVVLCARFTKRAELTIQSNNDSALYKEFPSMYKSFRLFFAALLVFALSAMCAAQSTTTGAVGVVVTDPQNAVVPNATVVVTNVETNKEDTATTDSEGRARIVNLQPGNYNIMVNGSGFGAYTRSSVVVEVGRVTSLDVPLTLTAQTAQVEVTSEAPVINTSQQDFSTNI